MQTDFIADDTLNQLTSVIDIELYSNKNKKNNDSPSKLNVVSEAPEVATVQKTPITQTGREITQITPLQKVNINSFTNSGMKVG